MKAMTLNLAYRLKAAQCVLAMLPMPTTPKVVGRERDWWHRFLMCVYGGFTIWCAVIAAHAVVGFGFAVFAG